MKSAEQKPSVIDRPLGSTESIYWLLDKLYGLNFVVFAEIEGRLDSACLAAALTTVQAENPTLRARIVQAKGRAWFKPVSSEAAALQPEVLDLRNWRRQIEDQLQAPFETGSAPLARFLWFKGAGRKSVVAMTFHHTIADGRSGTTVLLDVLRRATVDASPAVHKTARPSSQGLDTLRQQAPVLGALKGLKFWLDKGKDALKFAQQLPGYDPVHRKERKVRVVALGLDPAALTRLLAQARQQGTTVHAALGAAQLLAVNDQFPAKAARRLALNSLADLRASLSGDLSDRDLGLYITTLCTVHAIGKQPDFWRLAREIREALRQIIDAGDGNLIHGVYPSNFVLGPHENAAQLIQSLVTLAPSSSMLTNIGKVVEVDLGQHLSLRSMAFLVSPPAQHPICVTATTYAGRMSIQLLYDELKISRRQAQDIGDRLIGHLSIAAGGAPAA